MKHTPGPWIAGIEPTLKSIRIRSSNLDDPPVAHVYWSEVPPARKEHGRDQAEANARLIAAAPDLLAACKELLEVINDIFPSVRHIAVQDYQRLNEAPIRARQAIERAEA